VTEEREPIPSQRVGCGGDLRHPIDEVVIGTRWAVLRPPVTRQIEGHHAKPRQQRRQAVEAGRVVEPAVESDHSRTTLGTPLSGGETEMRNLEENLATAQR
jgi:hypothetical protein